ncbi:MAG: ComEC/Rec2 family competence protein [Acidobacteria bacterium]|nr:ComEC/Rec2 family competence protein [Acidobacteriota bacterium]
MEARQPGPEPALRLLALAGALSTGALAAGSVRPPWGVCAALAACALGVAIAARHRPASAWALLLAAGLLGLALADLRLASLDGSALAAGAARGADALLDGTVLAEPESDSRGTWFLLGVSRAEIDRRPFAVRERAWVSVRPPLRRPPRPGDRVRLDARLAPVERPGAAVAIQRAAARLRWKGVAARAYARADGIVRAGRSASPLTRIARAGRDAVRRQAGRLPERYRGLYLGVTIGDDSTLDPEIGLDFRATGLTHLLAVSGANVAMVLGAVGFGLRRAGAGPRATLAALAAALLSFMAVTQFEPSVLRAGAMAGLALAGAAVGARREALAGLGAASLVLLVYDPFLVRSAGFQLSALATFGILAVAPRLARALPRGKLGAAAAVTLGAQAAVTPLLALTFHQVSLVALPANLLAAPAVAPATVLGLLGAGAGAVWAPAGSLVVLTRPALAWMAGTAHVLAGVPYASVGTPAGIAGAGVALALALVGLGAVRLRRAAPLALALALLAAGMAWGRAVAPPPPRGLSLTALDIGQGDALLVRDPGGATMLLDGGPDPARLLARLRRAGVRRLDILALSHPDADHVDGLVPVAERYPIGIALDSGLDEEGHSAYRAAIAALARRGIRRVIGRAGMTLALGAATIEVLGPSEPLVAGSGSDSNNNSLVLRVTYGSDALMLTADVQEEGMEPLLARPDRLRATVLKVSHHGSRHMLPEFYAATRAGVAVISVGPNEYGHPSRPALEALAAAGMRVYRTDLSGDVTVGVDGGGGVSIRSERAAAA